LVGVIGGGRGAPFPSFPQQKLPEVALLRFAG
jgi:hypothetical protein